MSLIGQAMDRTDGSLKVTGGATFSAEHAVPRLAQAVMVTSTIANGRIAHIDTSTAQAMRGVRAVMTHQNVPTLPKQEAPPPGAQANPKLTLLQENLIHYNGQPIAVVVADTLEHARDAASHVRVRYAKEPAQLDFAQAKRKLRKPAAVNGKAPDSSRGNVAGSMARAAKKIDAVYTTPIENHNPMEPHATIAAWEGDQLTLHDATQNISGVRKTVAKSLGISPENVRVICPFVGGGFGCKGSTWSHVVLAAMAARHAGCPVKLAIERTQMFGPVGARPMTEQRLRLGAATDGSLRAIIHDTISHTSFVDDFTEPCNGWPPCTSVCRPICGRRAKHRAVSRWSRRSTNWLTRSRWIPCSCVFKTTPKRIRRRICLFPARHCANATVSAPNDSAGRSEMRNLGRCATVVRWSVGEWRQRPIPPTGKRPKHR
jgi:xanthine dehydrogenase YagR molybdenum-binding subunit